MIVKPKKIRKELANNEIRVINIDIPAVEEVLFENLMEHQSEYFYVNPIDDDTICQMKLNWCKGTLTYVVVPMRYILEGKKLDFNTLEQKGITVKSLFQANLPKFKTYKITDEMFLKE